MFKIPEGFQEASMHAVNVALKEDGWVLVLALDENVESEELAHLLNADNVQECLDNFCCFWCEYDSNVAERFEIEGANTLFAKGGEVERSWEIDDPEETDPEDIIQFLDDTLCFVE